MRSLQLVDHLSNQDLTARMIESKGTIDYSRWQLLYLIQVGHVHAAEVIAPLVNLSVHSVYKIVEKYNHKGEQAVRCKPKGGRRRSLLTAEEEKVLIDSFEQLAVKGQLKTANDMRAVVEKKVGKPVSDDYLWDLLHRHNWKKKMPRPHHPKRTAAEQDNFKKNFPKGWSPPL